MGLLKYLQGIFLTSVITENQTTAIQQSLTTFGETILDTFISLLPALALIAAVFFVIALVRSRVH